MRQAIERADGSWAVVLEKDRIRVLGEVKPSTFWREWWSEYKKKDSDR